jgi:hypothetical protein
MKFTLGGDENHETASRMLITRPRFEMDSNGQYSINAVAVLSLC